MHPDTPAFQCRAAPLFDAGSIVQGGLLGARVALGHPWLGGVGMCTLRLPHPCPGSPLPQSSGGCSRRPRCVWPPVWPRLCLRPALPCHHYQLAPTLALLRQTWCMIYTWCPDAWCRNVAWWYTTMPPSGRPKLPRMSIIWSLTTTTENGWSLQHRVELKWKIPNWNINVANESSL